MKYCEKVRLYRRTGYFRKGIRNLFILSPICFVASVVVFCVVYLRSPLVKLQLLIGVILVAFITIFFITVLMLFLIRYLLPLFCPEDELTRFMEGEYDQAQEAEETKAYLAKKEKEKDKK